MPLPTPEDYDNMIGITGKDHFISTKNTALKAETPNETIVYNSKYKLNFEGASRDYWNTKGPTCAPDYNKGDALAKFNDKSVSLDNFINSLFGYIKESMTSELHRNKITVEETKPYFDAIENNMKLLANHIKTIDNKSTDVNRLAAFLHGYVNAYVGNVINNELEKENEQKTKRVQ